MPLDNTGKTGSQMREFLDEVLPSEGLRCVAVPSARGGFKHFFYSDNAHAAQVIEHLDQQRGLNVYFGCSSFLTPESRKQANVAAIRSFWADIDCGEGKPYASAKDGLIALKNFLEISGLPTPTVVSSGRGLHCYWVMDADMDRATWKPVATHLKQAFAVAGLDADPSRTSDEASVLRPVGSHHRKGEAREVKLLKQGAPSSLNIFHSQVLAFLDANEVAPEVVRERAQPTPGINDEYTSPQEYPPTYAEKIANRCAQVAAMRDTQGDVSYEHWRGVIGLIRYCEEGLPLAEAWSARREETGHSQTDTAQKFDTWTSPPTTCSFFDKANPGGCEGCAFRGEISSPIRLGMTVPEVTAQAVAAQQAVIGRTSFTTWPAIMSEADALARMEHIIFVHNYGGSAGYVSRDADGSIRRITPQEISEGFNCYRVRVEGADGNPKLTPLGTYYMKSAWRSVADRIVYDPEGTLARPDEVTINTWKGFNKQPRRGCWSKMRRHLFNVICRRNSEHFRYLIHWLAWAVQRPGTAPGSVVVLQSEREGTGKSTVAEWMCRIFGRHGMMLNTPEQITGDFNGHLEGLSFLAVNEVTFAGNHTANRRFKSIVTEAQLLIHHKHQRPYTVPNMLHIMITTNEPWAVQAGVGARRFFVLDVDDCHANDLTYFAALRREADHRGIEAMLDFLLRLPLSKFQPAQVPRTSALAEQQERSASVEVQWALSMVEQTQGDFFLPTGKFGQTITTQELYRSYEAFAQARKQRYQTLPMFGRWFAKLGLPSAQISQARHKGYALPSAEEFRASVLRLAGIHAP